MTKEKVKQALLDTKREGIDKLVAYMKEVGFFTAPGSTKFHGNYEGGLLDHSINLYNLFKQLCIQYNLNVSKETQLITAFGHDLCKAGAYINNGHSISWNNAHPKGHAKLSLERIKQFITLTEQEEGIIKYHMGMYGTHEFSDLSSWSKGNGEYSLQELSNYWNNNKVSKLFYFCDDTVAQFKDIKK